MSEEQKPAETKPADQQQSTDKHADQQAKPPEQAQPDPELERLRTKLADRDTELTRFRAESAAREKKMADEQTADVQKKLGELESENGGLKSQIEHLKLEKQLTGKVLDPEASLKLMGSDFRNEDGTPNVDAFLEKHPYMKPAVTPNAPNGGGGTQAAGTGKEAQIEQAQKELDAATKSGNRALAVAAQTKLSNLMNQK